MIHFVFGWSGCDKALVCETCLLGSKGSPWSPCGPITHSESLWWEMSLFSTMQSLTFIGEAEQQEQQAVSHDFHPHVSLRSIVHDGDAGIPESQGRSASMRDRKHVAAIVKRLSQMGLSVIAAEALDAKCSKNKWGIPLIALLLAWHSHYGRCLCKCILMTQQACINPGV